MMEKIKRCPHCNSKSIRRWLTNGWVKCLDCDKISKYADWKEDEEPEKAEHVDMHDAFTEYTMAVSFMEIENPKVFTNKKCPVCHMVHSEVSDKIRYLILIIFYHLRAALIFNRVYKKLYRASKRDSKGKKSIRDKIERNKRIKKELKKINDRKKWRK